MKVFEFKEFPNPACVGIALAEKQMTDQVDFISINIPAGEHNEPAFLEKSSNGTVPVLELDEGTIISECTAITEYIDSLSGERVLSGQSPKERVVFHMMQRRAEANSLDAISTYFHHATPGLGTDIERRQCAEWRGYQRDHAIGGMRYFNSVLGNQPFIAGEVFTMADITIFAGLVFADFTNMDIPPECKNLKDWHKRVSNRRI